ncbi:helix-turn-helix domain-containing protein [Pseudomonas kurunegalensis]|uniref:helix-turn-helix domain-containing protein n=1 Tax=Pseudomonas kurunegalensis TaxID=485880 RepID=UPI002119A390|nr:helix-turn-helix transcriptional regulator [Pseudomonas kurunegalensis]
MLIAEGVSERLREERDRKGLTQLEFATLVGVSRGTQKNYELGAAVGAMDLKYLASLEANGIDATYVLTGQRTIAAGLTDEEFTLLERYREIPEQDQRALRRFLKAMFDDANQ